MPKKYSFTELLKKYTSMTNNLLIYFLINLKLIMIYILILMK